jgi:hypothetical protein
MNINTHFALNTCYLDDYTYSKHAVSRAELHSYMKHIQSILYLHDSALVADG